MLLMVFNHNFTHGDLHPGIHAYLYLSMHVYLYIYIHMHIYICMQICMPISECINCNIYLVMHLYILLTTYAMIAYILLDHPFFGRSIGLFTYQHIPIRLPTNQSIHRSIIILIGNILVQLLPSGKPRIVFLDCGIGELHSYSGIWL
jgi:hypothetical protein